ncbi:MAG: hypothetical protein V9H69_23660 [Anaerolineae bacterium]
MTHNLTALLMMPVALLHLGVLAVWTRRWRRLWGAAGALALAAGLSALFWLPALVESRAVGLSVGASAGYANHMLTAATWLRRSVAFFLNPPETLGPVFPLSWFALALVAVGLILLLRRLPSFRKDDIGQPPLPLVGFHLAVAIGAMFMTTAASLFIWQPLTSLLGQLQYPWRFLLLEAVGLMGVAAALPALLAKEPSGDRVGVPAVSRSADRVGVPAVSRSADRVGVPAVSRSADRVGVPAVSRSGDRVGVPAVSRSGDRVGVPAVSRSAWIVVAVSLLAMLAALPGLRVEPLPVSQADARLPGRMWDEDAAAGQVGATWTGEFLPLTVTEQRWALGRGREGAVDGPALQPAPVVTLARRGYASWAFQMETASPLPLRLHQFHQPGWNATVDGQSATTYPTDELGLATVDVPAGTHQVAIAFGSDAGAHGRSADHPGGSGGLDHAGFWTHAQPSSAGNRRGAGGGGRGAGAERGPGRRPAHMDAAAGAGHTGGCGRAAGGRCGGAPRPGRGRNNALLAGAARDGRKLQGLRPSAGARRRGDRPAGRRSGGRLHAHQPLAAGRDRRRPARAHPARGAAGRRVRAARRAVPGGAAAQPDGRSAGGRQPGGYRRQ